MSDNPSFPRVSNFGSGQKPLRPPVKPVSALEKTFLELPLSGKQALLADAKAFAQEKLAETSRILSRLNVDRRSPNFVALVKAANDRFEKLVGLIDEVEGGKRSVSNLKQFEDLFAKNGILSPFGRSKWIRERVDDLRENAEIRIPNLERKLKQFDEDAKRLALPFPTKDSAITRTDRIAIVAKLELAKADLIFARKIENGEMSAAQYTAWQAAQNTFVREALLIVPDVLNLASMIVNPTREQDDIVHDMAHTIRKKIETKFPRDTARQHEFLQKAATIAGTAAGNFTPQTAIGKVVIRNSIPAMEKLVLKLLIGRGFKKIQSFSREELREDSTE